MRLTPTGRIYQGCIPREMSRQHVDRALPRERGRSYMRIGKIFTLEARIVTTAITDRGRGRRRLVTVLIVSSSCCYHAEWPAILRTIGRRWRATCFVPRAFSGRFARGICSAIFHEGKSNGTAEKLRRCVVIVVEILLPSEVFDIFTWKLELNVLDIFPKRFSR